MLVESSIKRCFQFAIVLNAPPCACINQTLRFAEMMVIGAKDNRYAVHGCLYRIVDPYTETAAYIGYLSELVNGTEQTYCIYYHHLCVAENIESAHIGRHGMDSTVFHYPALEQVKDPMQVLLVDLMRH